MKTILITETDAFGVKHDSAARVSDQAAKVVNLLKRDGRVTRLTAMHYGVANVTARISELRLDADLAIRCENKRDANGNLYGEWSFAPGTSAELA